MGTETQYLENEYLRLTFEERGGQLTGIYDKENDRELLWESIETDKAVMEIPAQCRSVFLNKDTTVRRLTNYPINTGSYLLARADSRSAAVNQLIEFFAGEFQEKREAENQLEDRLFHTGRS